MGGDSRGVLLWILLVVVTVVAGVGAVGVAARNQRKQLTGGRSNAGGRGTQRALPAGDGEMGSAASVERGLAELRVDDVVAMDDRDFLCEGLIAYDEDGHRWLCGRIIDGSEVKWLLVGLERAAQHHARLLAEDDASAITGYPPEAMVVGDTRYMLDKRGAATCQ